VQFEKELADGECFSKVVYGCRILLNRNLWRAKTMIKAMDYRSKAIECVKNTVLPIQRAQFDECGHSLDEQYKKYGNTEFFYGKVIKPGHIYEVGYPKCVCEEVLSGKVTNVSHCECSRNSILYILQNLLPKNDIQVEIIHTVLGGADNCRFKVTVR
jgi:hypothetical protein